MKKICFLLLALIAFAKPALAQFNESPIINLENFDKKPLSWGYFLGFNQYDFKFEYNENLGDVLVSKSMGFNVGLVGKLRLNNYFDIRFEPGLYYTKRDVGFRGFTDANDALREVKSTYIHFPLLLRANTKRLGNWRPFIVGGVSTSMNLGSNEDSKEDNSSGQFRMKKNTFYYEVGFGIDFYLEYFKFSPSIRGVFAMSNELVPDVDPNSPWTGNIANMYSRGIFINFTFE